MKKVVSIIIVNHNGKEYLDACISSLLKIDKRNLTVKIIVVDNLSQDESVSFVKERFPNVRVLENDENNYARGINLGIKNSKGNYVAILNNDTTVERNWLKGLLEVLDQDEKIGAVQSKILFSKSKKINSVGVEEVKDFYFKDIGFGESNLGQYEEVKEITFFSGGSVLLKKECLNTIGDFDEEFIMYYEDVDYSIRCKAEGWKLFYVPDSIVYHRYLGTGTTVLCEYLCSRNRLLCLAKHFPARLPQSIKTSHFYLKKEYDNLCRSLLQSAKKLVEYNDTKTTIKTLDKLKDVITDIFVDERAYNFFSHLELMLGLRKIKIGIYDHAFHFAGDGQKYTAKIAELLQDRYDITYITNKDISLDKYKEWFNIDLSKCRLKIIKVPFYERLDKYFIDEGMVTREEHNPFDIISKESLLYDIFINANMLTKVKPLSTLSIFICHFPDRDKEKFFYVDKYDHVISNGTHDSLWIEKRWGINRMHCIHAPADLYNSSKRWPYKKKKTIISVCRFELGGSKKQLEMVEAFIKLALMFQKVRHEWTFILAGGNSLGNYYFDKVKKKVDSSRCNIKLIPDISFAELKKLYCKASIFWHACGLNETTPHLIEHSGMATVEAMQNYCVPVVYDGGAQMEIVIQGESGFRFKTIEAMQAYTIAVINNDVLREKIATNAYERSHNFNFAVFKKNIFKFFSDIEKELIGVDALSDNFITEKKSFSDKKRDYAWISNHEPPAKELHVQRKTRFTYQPKISIIVPTYNTPEQFIRDMVESVKSQTYTNWELCIADGASERTVTQLLKWYEKRDRRISIKFLTNNKGIAGNSNEALSLATGEFVGFLDHDDELTPDALYEVVRAINENPYVDFLYTDEIRMDSKGKTLSLTFRPQFSEYYYMSHPYIVHFNVFRKSLIDSIRGFNSEDFQENVSHDVDFVLRIIASTEPKRIIHIPKPLYKWRIHDTSAGHVNMEKVNVYTKKALQRFLDTKGLNGYVEDGILFNTFRIRFRMREQKKVSIIILTKNNYAMLLKNLKSIKEKTDYNNYEVLIISNNTTDKDAIRFLESMQKEQKYRVIEDNRPFNYSALNNFGVEHTEGEYLLFLNDDIEVINREWLTSMVEIALDQRVGIVGAKLLYPDNHIQHAGVVLGLVNGKGEHTHKFMNAFVNKKRNIYEAGYGCSLVCVREYSAVTGACMLTKRTVFEKCMGMSEELKYGYNDIDFCLRVRECGYLVLFTPYALLYHHESISRKVEGDAVMQHVDDLKLFEKKWKELLQKGDPYYSPNLSLKSYIPICKSD